MRYRRQPAPWAAIAKSNDRTTLAGRPAPVAAERRDGREADIEISGGGDVVVTGRPREEESGWRPTRHPGLGGRLRGPHPGSGR